MVRELIDRRLVSIRFANESREAVSEALAELVETQAEAIVRLRMEEARRLASPSPDEPTGSG